MQERLFQDAEEAIPGDMPPPRGNASTTHCFVDADLAGNTVTRRSQTGILMFVNRALEAGVAPGEVIVDRHG